jgi:hypothetical protein
LEPEGEEGDPLGVNLVEMLQASESDMAEADWDCHHPISDNVAVDLDDMVTSNFKFFFFGSNIHSISIAIDLRPSFKIKRTWIKS